MKRIFLLFILLLNSLYIQSQDVKGVVLNKNNGKPVVECLVILKGTTQSTLTDEKGRFEFILDNQKTNTLVFTTLGYTTIEYELSVFKKDTFYISPKDILLKEVVISADKKSVLNPKNDESILDFDLLNDNLLILTAGSPKNNLRLIDEMGIVLSNAKIDGHSEILKDDCIGNLHALSNDSSWQIFYDYTKLNFLEANTRQNFENVLGNCVCMNNKCYYFQTKTYRNLRTNYFYYNENEKGVRHELAKFQDSAKIRGFELDYNLQYFLEARRRSHYTMYNEPVDSIKLKMEKYRTELPLDWTYKSWLGQVETQMIKIDTNTFIVNFTDTVIYDVTKNNELKFKTRFPAFKNKKTLSQVYTDADYRETYLIAFADSKLTFIKFDINTGKELSKSEISNVPFLPRKIVINSGKAYFIQKNLADEQSYKIIKYYLN